MNGKYGYVLLKCDGTVEVVECDRNTDCEKIAVEKHGFSKCEMLEPILSLGGIDTYLQVLNDFGEIVKSNRAASGLIDGGCTGDVIICDYLLRVVESEPIYCPLPLELAEIVADHARTRMTSEDEWEPNGTVREGFLESLEKDLGEIAKKFGDTSRECETARAGIYLVSRMKRRIEELKNSDGEDGNRVLGELLTIAYGRCTR